MNLSTRLTFGLRAIASAAGGILETLTQPAIVSKTLNWTNGTGADQANQVYTTTTTVPAGQSTSQILRSGLTDAFGTALTPARIKAIYLENTGTVAITVGGSAAIIGSGFTLRAGESMLKAAGDATAYAVGNPCTLDFTNAAGVSTTVKVVLVFASA